MFAGSNSFPPRLTKDEERTLLQAMSNGTTEEKEKAREKLITHNLRLVAHIAKKYDFKSNEEFISIGIIGLIKAIVTFDVNRGAELGTYAARCIDNEILMSLRQKKKTGAEISIDEVLSTDNNGCTITIGDKLAATGYSIDEEIEMRYLNNELYAAIIDCLTPAEREIIVLRYGLSGNSEHTQKETAAIKGISRSYVSRIEKKAIKKLNKALADNA